MYIEVTHDKDGNIGSCYCTDSLPVQDGEPLFSVKGGLPPGKEQVRIVIDTLTAMEIDQNCGEKAIIDKEGNPQIIYIDRTLYIRENYKVELIDIAKPNKIKLSPNLKLRRLIRKNP